MTLFIFILIGIILLFIAIYRKQNGENVYKYIINSVSDVYNKYAPYSYKVVKEKVKAMGQDYTTRQYVTQVLGFAAFSGIISYLYFYNLIISAIYILITIMFIPYLNYLRCKRIYSEFIFEQIQVYTTNTIMEFATTQAFVKSLEGVYESNILEDPVKTDVKMMIEMAYDNGTIDESIKFFNNKYDFNITLSINQTITYPYKAPYTGKYTFNNNCIQYLYKNKEYNTDDIKCSSTLIEIRCHGSEGGNTCE